MRSSRCLQSDWLTQGPTIERFEAGDGRALPGGITASRCATPRRRCTSPVWPQGWAPGDSLVDERPTPFSRRPTAGVIAAPRSNFVDIDPLTWNLDVNALAAQARSRRAVTENFAEGAGGGCVLRAELRHAARLPNWRERYNFVVIEDASHAVGARYAGRPVGCGEFAGDDRVQFSSGENHHQRRGRHGVDQLVLQLAERLQRLRSHGMTRDPQQMDANRAMAPGTTSRSSWASITGSPICRPRWACLS
jgi:hypothetical protein